MTPIIPLIITIATIGWLLFAFGWVCYMRGRYIGQIEGQSEANYRNHRRAVMLVRRKANPFWINRRNN